MFFWRNTARIFGAALLAASVVAAAPTQAQQRLERVLGGVRLNSNAQAVLSRFGNPSQIVVGEVGIRLPGEPGAPGTPGAAANPFGGQQPAGAQSPFPVQPGFDPGSPFGVQSPFGAQPGAGQVVPPDAEDPMGLQSPAAGVGPFGRTLSRLDQAQEVTWIYNRPGNVTLEFLIGPEGRVTQIKAIGRGGGGIRTQRGVGLGSSYADVVRNYGYGEEYQQVGPILVASYRNRANAAFQFLGGRVVAITISTVE